MVALLEHRQDRLPGRDDVVDEGGPGGRVRAVEPVQLGAHLLLAARAGGVHQRLVEAAEAHPAGDVADDRVTHLRRRDQVLQRAQVLLPRGRRQRGDAGGVGQPLQQVQQHQHVRRGAAVREEDPVERGGERLVVGIAELEDAVVRERGAQPGAERLGQALGVGVARAQEGVEVLLRVVGRAPRSRPRVHRRAEVGRRGPRDRAGFATAPRGRRRCA